MKLVTSHALKRPKYNALKRTRWREPKTVLGASGVGVLFYVCVICACACVYVVFFTLL